MAPSARFSQIRGETAAIWLRAAPTMAIDAVDPAYCAVVRCEGVRRRMAGLVTVMR